MAADHEIAEFLATLQAGGYDYLRRAELLYPDRDWKDAVFHEDHIFPKARFKRRELKKRGYEEGKLEAYMGNYNNLCNLQLLTEAENLSKNQTPFDEWFKTRDEAFRGRHLIPDLTDYSFDRFDEFVTKRTELIRTALSRLQE